MCQADAEFRRKKLGEWILVNREAYVADVQSFFQRVKQIICVGVTLYLFAIGS